LTTLQGKPAMRSGIFHVHAIARLPFLVEKFRIDSEPD